MKNYKSTEEKLVFSPRMERVYRDVLTRLKENREREKTETSPVGTEGRDPFLEVFEEMPDAPLVIAQAYAIVHSWMITPFLIFRDEPLVGITRPEYRNIEHFHWGIMTDGLRSHINEQPEAEQKKRWAMIRRMEPLDYGHIKEKAVELLGQEKWQILSHDGMFDAGDYQGHTVANYVTLLTAVLTGCSHMSMNAPQRMTAIRKHATSMRRTESSYAACLLGSRVMPQKPQSLPKVKRMPSRSVGMRRSRQTAPL